MQWSAIEPWFDVPSKDGTLHARGDLGSVQDKECYVVKPPEGWMFSRARYLVIDRATATVHFCCLAAEPCD